jgi:hypothetical protein
MNKFMGWVTYLPQLEHEQLEPQLPMKYVSLSSLSCTGGDCG